MSVFYEAMRKVTEKTGYVVKNAIAEGDFICRGISKAAPVELF